MGRIAERGGVARRAVVLGQEGTQAIAHGNRAAQIRVADGARVEPALLQPFCEPRSRGEVIDAAARARRSG